MKVVFHIGMGKTGTSSIQKALDANTQLLSDQKVVYLGMWFDILGAEFSGQPGLEKLFSLPAEDLAKYGELMANKLVERAALDGTEVFIFSNESLFGRAQKVHHFLEAFQHVVPLTIVAYLRDPYSWLPSAFTQWSIYHKVQKGPIKPFHIRGRTLIGQYRGLYHWVEHFKGILTVRSFEKSTDVVQDFASAVAIQLPPNGKRHLTRGEPAEVVLRALFNNRFEDPIMPDRFNRVVFAPGRRPVPPMQDIVKLCFQHDVSAEIVAENREMFEFIRDAVGLDYFGPAPAPKDMPDMAELQSRLVDYLAEIAMSQGLRLAKLERQMKELTDNSKAGARLAIDPSIQQPSLWRALYQRWRGRTAP